MKPLAANPLPALADEILRALPRMIAAHPTGVALTVIRDELGVDVANIRAAARKLNVDGRAVLMRRVNSREHFIVPASFVTRQAIPGGLRCCVQCGKAFKIAKWHCPAKRGNRLAFSPRKTCSQTCAALIAVQLRGGRAISQERKTLCISLRLEHNLSAPAIAKQVGICTHSAYRILKGYPAWVPTKRKPVRGVEWTAEHDAVLRQLYPHADQTEIERELVGHTWLGIERRASFLKVRRRRQAARRNQRPTHPVVAELLNYREQNGLARCEVARRCGIAHGQILGWELGKTNPRLDDVSKWARALGFELVLRGAA